MVKGEKGDRAEKGGKNGDDRGYDRGGYGKGGYDREDKGGYGKGGYDKGDGKGKKGGKGKPQWEEKLVSSDLRGKVIKIISAATGKKPSGFIKRYDGDNKADVYFDLEVVIGGEEVKIGDPVEFDVVEGSGQRLYAARVKLLPKGTELVEEKSQGHTYSAPIKASTAGSLTAAVSLAPGGGKKLGAGKLSGGLSLRPGGALTLAPGGGLSMAPKEKKKEEEEPPDGPDADGIEWGRIVSVRNAFGFLRPLGGFAQTQDVFFKAADVIGMNSTEPGLHGNGLQITLPNGRNANGFRSFWLTEEDEVSFQMSKDHTGKPCAVAIFKEKKGAWRMGRAGNRGGSAVWEESLKDQVDRLLSMDTDQVLQNASLFKEVLDSPEFNPSHLYKIISLLASKELADDDRSATMYRLFLHSKSMQANLRTTIIKQAQGGANSGNFLQDCLTLLHELTVRSSSPADLRGQLPLIELMDALESNIREGSSMTKKGLPEEVQNMVLCLQKHFPDEVNLNRILGIRAPKKVRTVAQDSEYLMEADYYQDMPILPTSNEMLEQAAFEIEQNMRTYEKCEDYIQTHFMLLREDYIEPLRLGIKQFMQNKHSPKDLHVYTDVKVVGLLSTFEGIVYRVQLPKSAVRNINWEKSKQLMYGSLLCFSDDDFQTLIWGTVWKRDTDLISQEAQLDIRLPFEPIDDRLVPGKSFVCIENVTIYFEAYRHVLVALQNMKPADVPFQDTLLQSQPKPVPPTFLANDDMFHFHNVFASCVKEDSPVPPPKCFNVLQDWPETIQQSLDIDPSQLEAIQHALTNQMALIQGPPGTGKTWVGLKIVQALLDNTRTSRQSPVLVVCYTNHALDQFLEGIFKFCERIARIGSRSKSECLANRNLKELVFGMDPSKEYYQARRALNDRRDDLRDKFCKILNTVNKHLVKLEDAEELFTEKKLQTFFEGYKSFLRDNRQNVKHLPPDVDHEEFDEDLWELIMKAWLELNDLTKIAKPMIPHMDEKKKKKAEQEFGDWEELAADDQGEEEAEAEQNDRKLDVEQTDTNARKPQDFCMELKNAWLPYMEDHLAKLSPEMLTLSSGWQDLDDLWSNNVPISCRREIYRRWLLEAHHEAREEIPEIARMLERNAENRAALERDRKLALLREMEVVGMTTTAVSKYSQLLKELRPEIVIVEEAAEVLEAHILTALHPRTQHVILIGDHQQLRPSTAVYRLSKNFHLDVSLFERLIKNQCAHVTLEQQRRMHPKISRLMKPLYPSLRDHSSVSEYPEIMGIDARMFFMTHGHLEDAEADGSMSHSKENTFEANFIGSLCAHLVKSGYEESQITVLSPYLGQVRVLKNRFRRDLSIANVQITAVDNFQGEENDIIVISLVRSNRAKAMGFLAVDNRVNVALTRAKHGMFIVGNSDMLRGHKLWDSIITTLESDGSFSDKMPLIEKETGVVLQVNSSDEIQELLLDGEIGDGEEESPSKPGALTFSLADRCAGLFEKKDDGGKGKGKSRGRGEGAPKKKTTKKNDGRLPPGAPDPRAPAGSNGNGRAAGQQKEAPSQGEDGKELEPPPARVEADELGDEAELVPGKDKDEGRKALVGKKQKKKYTALV